jgi:hypothetical protein
MSQGFFEDNPFTSTKKSFELGDPTIISAMGVLSLE